MIAQHQTDAASSPMITNLTTMCDCQNRAKSENVPAGPANAVCTTSGFMEGSPVPISRGLWPPNVSKARPANGLGPPRDCNTLWLTQSNDQGDEGAY